MTTQQAPSPTFQATQQPTPARIFETLNRYQHSLALKGAIDLELFTHIASGATTPVAIAKQCSASVRGVRILCDFLTIAGFLTKSDKSYGLTPESSLFLNKLSPAYMGSIASFLVSDETLACFQDVAALVRKGPKLNVACNVESKNGVWVEFARSMAPIAALSAQLVAPHVSSPGRKLKVLDVAAGHGLFGITIAKQNPEAEIFALDWKNVLEVALENAGRAGVRDRYHTIPGDAFTVDLQGGYDLVLIPNFLHHFDVPTNIEFLKRIKAAMNPGGKLASVEFVPNDDRVSPPVAASFSMIMLGRTERGDAYTFRELDRMFREAGFGESQMRGLEPSPQTLILTEA